MFLTNAAMRANIGIAGNPPMKDELYYCFETGKQGYWYWAVGASEADNEGLVIVTTTGSHRLKRVFLNSSYVFQNWFTGTGDAWFASVAAANTAIAAAYRKQGMRVFIMEDVVEEYWYRDGTADGDLVPVAGEIGIDNGPTTDGAVEMLSAPDPFTIFCKSLLLEGINGVNVTWSIVDGLLRWTIDGGAFPQVLTGTYATRLATPTNLGTTFFQTDQLFGRYIADGSTWSYQPGTDTLVLEQWLSNLPNSYSTGNITGTGAGSFIDSTTIGRWRNDTGTTSTGTSAVRLSQSFASSFSGIERLVMYVEKVQVTALSDGTNRFIVRVGKDTGADQNGFWFEYSDNINSGKWLCVNCNSGSRTTSDSGVTVSASATYVMCAVLDFAGTDNVKFYINGTQVGTTHTTNIPANLTSSFWGAISIEKTLGTSNRGVMFGRVLINCKFTIGV